MKPEVFDVAAQFYNKMSRGPKPSEQQLGYAKRICTGEDKRLPGVGPNQRSSAKNMAANIERHLTLLTMWANSDSNARKYLAYCSKDKGRRPDERMFNMALDDVRSDDNQERYCVKALQKRIAIWDGYASKLKEVL